MEFEERQKLLVECYNHLEITFGNDGLEGYYTDGTQTLPENIADVGGVNIIYDAYKAKLQKEGYSGEELLKQKRKFFLGIADLWRIKRSPAFMLLWYNDWKAKTDAHAIRQGTRERGVHQHGRIIRPFWREVGREKLSEIGEANKDLVRRTQTIYK